VCSSGPPEWHFQLSLSDNQLNDQEPDAHDGGRQYRERGGHAGGHFGRCGDGRALAQLFDAHGAAIRYQQLAGQLLSMADVEAVWGDLVTTTKWLFLVLPQRARMEVPGLTDAQHEGLMRLCRAMLSEVAIKGQAQLPGAGRHQEGR
jgi:hypothetical protein